jgi:2,4-dienoyl-CoA reductase (NADPH2)
VIDWLERQCRKAGVNIECNKQVTSSDVEKIKPDVVIVATGATPSIPQLPGVERGNVVTAWDVLAEKGSVGKRVIVFGGDQCGVETADFLAEKGLAETVTIIEMLPEVAWDMDVLNRSYIMQKLLEYHVKILTNLKITEITAAGASVIDREWNRETVEADTVVLAAGSAPNNKLAEQLKGKVPQLYKIGDCVKPRKIIDGMSEAAYVSRQI